MSCPTGKIPYRTGSEAWRALRGFTARKGPAPTLDAYHCQFCGAWHLGRRPKKAKHAKARVDEQRVEAAAKRDGRNAGHRPGE